MQQVDGAVGKHESKTKRSRTDLKGFFSQRMSKLGVLGALIALMVVSTFISPRFLSVNNLLNVTQQISIVGVLALGMTFIIMTAGIDLSVGATLSLTSVVAATALSEQGVAAGVLVTLAVGGLIGLVNGLGVVLGNIPPFVMTLATMASVTGAAFIFSGGLPVAVKSDAFVQLGNGRLFGVPIPALLLLVLAILCSFVLNRTVFGRGVYAVGSNTEAARLSGVPVGRTLVMVYVIGGLSGAVGGMLFAAQLGSGNATAGSGTMPLDVIAAVVIGGTSLFGGLGTISGTLLGAAILGVLANVLNLAGVQTYVQDVLKGGIIVAAILLQMRLTNRKG